VPVACSGGLAEYFQATPWWRVFLFLGFLQFIGGLVCVFSISLTLNPSDVFTQDK
jgi:uncharacterized membrane protein HdeD (DUF308 family)